MLNPIRKRVLVPVVVVAGLAVFSLGKASGNTATVEHPVPVPGPTVTVDRDVEKPVTSQVCLDALDDADRVITLAGNAFGAIGEGNPSWLVQHLSELKSDMSDYTSARDRCRRGAADFGG